MRVWHLDCGPMRPIGGGLLDGAPGRLRRAELVAHVLLVECDAGLVLVDTGYGLADTTDPPGALPAGFVRLVNPLLRSEHTAAARIEALGRSRSEVRHIVLTHLDLDHAGGLRDFPDAEVHVLGAEYAAAMDPTWRESNRYLPAQWAHGPRWRAHEPTGGVDWFDMAGVTPIPGLPEGFLMVPLVGHTRGHCGVAVRGEDGWLLHAGDAYFNRAQLTAGTPTPPLARVFGWVVQTRVGARVASERALRRLVGAHGSEVTVFSAHDAAELAALAG